MTRRRGAAPARAEKAAAPRLRPGARSEAPERSSIAADVCICLALVLAVAAAYAPVAGYGFVNFDDPEYVYENPHVRRGLTWTGIVWAFGYHAANWHPLTWLSHMLDCQLFGPEAGAMHVSSAVMHAAAAVVLFLALQRMTAARWPSAVVAGLFALHPLRVESVAWISERKDVLSTLLWMLTLLAYAWYVERRSWRRYTVVVLAYVAGLLAKPMVVTLPFALLLLDLWPLRRVSLTDGARDRWIPVVLEKLPLLALAAATSLVVYEAQSEAGAVTSFAALPLAARIANALLSYVSYLAMTVWPQGMAAFYPYREVFPPLRVAGAALVLGAVTVAAMWRSRREPWLLVGWLWYLGTLVPVIGIIRAGDQAMADRFVYIPQVGLWLMLVWSVATRATAARARIAAGAAAVIALVACTAATRVQLAHWRDSEALFGRALAVTRNNALAHTNYGFAILEQGRAEEALSHFERAVALKPYYAKAQLNLGLGLGTLGRSDEAIAAYHEALRLAPDYAVAHYDLGLELSEVGRLDEAIAAYREALRLDPTYAKAHNNLGLALARQGHAREALAHYEQALALEPDLAAVHNNIAVVLESLGRGDEALAHYREAVRLSPRDARAHFNLASVLSGGPGLAEAAAEYRETLRLNPGLVEARIALGDVLARQGQEASALAEYRAALEARPGWVPVETRLAWSLATGRTARDPAEAVRLAESARARAGDDPDVLRALGAAYAAAGRFADAADVARPAIALARARGNAPLTAELEQHLAAYSAGRALP
jgi:tetratricopeptide (TPR) repeat protein